LAISRVRIKARWQGGGATAVELSRRQRDENNTSKARNPIKDYIKLTFAKSAVREGGARGKRRRDSGEGGKAKGQGGFRPGNVLRSQVRLRQHGMAA
jgi:hypothetical protein